MKQVFETKSNTLLSRIMYHSNLCNYPSNLYKYHRNLCNYHKNVCNCHGSLYRKISALSYSCKCLYQLWHIILWLLVPLTTIFTLDNTGQDTCIHKNSTNHCQPWYETYGRQMCSNVAESWKTLWKLGHLKYKDNYPTFYQITEWTTVAVYWSWED